MENNFCFLVHLQLSFFKHVFLYFFNNFTVWLSPVALKRVRK